MRSRYKLDLEAEAEVTETLIIPNITKTNSDSCFIMHCFQENKDKHRIAWNTV